MDREEIVVKLKRFKKDVSKKYPRTEMILFGSQAYGKPHRDSDIDLIVISPSFRRKKRLERGLWLYNHWNLNYPVDFLCYTPEEFKKLSGLTTIVREAKEKGIEI